jgi:cold shock CspA family protein
MEIPIRIVCRGMSLNDAIEAQVRILAEKLAPFSELIQSCRVEINRAGKAMGEPVVVAIRIAVPGSVIAVDDGIAHTDLAQALGIAYAEIKVPLEALARRQRGDLAATRLPSHGHVKRLLDGFGFIEAADGRSVLFRRAHCSDPSIEHLTVGDAVRFVAIFGPDGLHASQVALAKHPVV